MADELNLLEIEIAIYAIDRAGVAVLGENAGKARDKLNRQRVARLRAAGDRVTPKRQSVPLPLLDPSDSP